MKSQGRFVNARLSTNLQTGKAKVYPNVRANVRVNLAELSKILKLKDQTSDGHLRSGRS